MHTVWLPGFAGPETLPAEAGVPAALGGEIRVQLCGAHICLTARLPEPGGKVLARSMGRNPIWDKDATASPEVEDRIRWRLRYRRTGGVDRTVTIEINPWGAYRVEEAIELLRSARVDRQGWTAEAAIPLQFLDLDWTKPVVEYQAERIRSRRAQAPEYRWKQSGALTLPARTAIAWSAPPPEIRPPVAGNSSPALEIGRVPRLPPVVADWDHPEWQDIPSFSLARNEPDPRAPRYPTRVKWMHDGHTLALLFRVEEPEPVVARAGGRDSAVTSDDHVAIYLATSGSAFLEIAVNSVGAIRDSFGHRASQDAAADRLERRYQGADQYPPRLLDRENQHCLWSNARPLSERRVFLINGAPCWQDTGRLDPVRRPNPAAFRCWVARLLFTDQCGTRL